MPPAETNCGNEVVDLTPTGVNVMVAIDGSASMRAHWPRVRDAVARLRKENPQSSFGIHLFYGAVVENLDELFEKNNLCGKTQNKVLDVGERSEQELLDYVGMMPPGPNTRILPTSPLVEPINYYLTNPTKLSDPTRTNYLVVVSDGVDNCFGSSFAGASDKRLALEKLAVDLNKKNIRVLPISFVAGQMTNANGMPSVAVQARIDALDTLAKFGGAGIEKALVANKPEDLGTAISQAGQRAGNCRFSIPASLDPSKGLNPFELTFSVNGQALSRDRRNTNGWNFVGGTTTEVELFGQACEAVRSGVKVEAKKSCSRQVCGTAAVQVETKPRAVLYLLDSSASRLECQSGDPLRCLLPQGNTTMPDFSYWDIVATSLGRSLVAPINDDIQSGLQFFPAKTSGLFSCEVGDMPEVPTTERSQITIMSKMLERLPFGRSPVVAALKSVADSPGMLADPKISGAVVMLTDGGDNCNAQGEEGMSAANQAAVVASLEASADKLLQAGIKTYVVRFGNPAAKTPEQEAQLRAIVTKGGTATIDPNDASKPPYVDAVDATALDAALAKVSDRLASCTFAVEGIAMNVDKSKANLYLNGELIRFDQVGQALDGWSWANPEKTAIELHGNACTAFKTNRKTSVGVEFGCPSEVLL
ncbi:MAG TPA: VWA domain-containing protein [Polyangiales bacterium]